VSFIAAMLLLGEFDYSDELGFAIAIAALLWQWRKKPAQVAATA